MRLYQKTLKILAKDSCINNINKEDTQNLFSFSKKSGLPSPYYKLEKKTMNRVCYKNLFKRMVIYPTLSYVIGRILLEKKNVLAYCKPNG